MDPLLSKVLYFVFIICFSTNCLLSQEVESDTPEYPDYKNKEQFEKFYWRRKIVSAWQIKQLKSNALVVRLKTNKLAINALIKNGDTRAAEKKRVETLITDLNIYKAFQKNYKFSKVYFLFSDYTDSLLNGVRKNIFLDSNLHIDPSIEMTENFYLIGEPDYIYNSSIGYVKEDSARYQRESGSTNQFAPIILKNKYGHQLKSPFPYYVYLNKYPLTYQTNDQVYFEGKQITIDIDTNIGYYEVKNPYYFEGSSLKIAIPLEYTLKVYSYIIYNLNEKLNEYFENAPNPEQNKRFEEVKPFLY